MITLFWPKTPFDGPAIGALHQEAFGGTRVPDLVDALRDHPAVLAPLGFVAEEGGQVVGHVMLSASRLDAPRRLVDVYVLSPLGVSPAHRRQGIATALIERAVEAAERAGAPLLFLEGDPAFYGPRGFERASTLGFRTPSLRIPDAAFQVRRLSAFEPWMTGTLVYAEPFWACDCVGLRDPGAVA